MNNFLKGAGIVLGIPLVLAASVFVFVPGLPGKLYVQKKCQSKDITIMEYQHGDVAVPVRAQLLKYPLIWKKGAARAIQN